jgi:hypothetical protein
LIDTITIEKKEIDMRNYAGPPSLLEVIAQYDIQKKVFITKTKEVFFPFLQSLLGNEFVAYRFCAYTPYFNDGDECVYRIRDVYVKLPRKPFVGVKNGSNVNIPSLDLTGVVVECNEEIVSIKLKTNKIVKLAKSEVFSTDNNYQYADKDGFMDHYSVDGPEKEVAESINDIIRNLPAPMVMDIFGDHVQITVSKDSIMIEKYEHD